MKIIFLPHKNTDEEIQLGQKINFTPIHGLQAISVTANLNGFTPMAAVLEYLKVKKKTLIKEVHHCSFSGIVKLIPGWPNIILVPPTRGPTYRNKWIEYYMIQILKICNAENFKELQFNHYGFINGTFQKGEVSRILSVLLNPLIYTTLEAIYWEIDARYVETMTEIYSRIDENINGVRASDPIIFDPSTMNFPKRYERTNANYWRNI